MSEVARYGGAEGGREGGVKARPILVYGGGMEVNLVLPLAAALSIAAPSWGKEWKGSPQMHSLTSLLRFHSTTCEAAATPLMQNAIK